MINSSGFQTLVGFSEFNYPNDFKVHRSSRKITKIGEITIVALLGPYEECKVEFEEQLLSLKEILEPNWLILFPENDQADVIKFIEQILEIPSDTWKPNKNPKFIQNFNWLQTNLLTLLQIKKPSTHIQFSFYSSKLLTDNTLPGPEDEMTEVQLITKFWADSPKLRNIMTHAYLLQASGEYKKASIFPEIKRRVGEKPSEFEFHIGHLEDTQIMEHGGSCYLRTDNGAYEAIEKHVSSTYHINQNLNDISGVEFLNSAFDGRQSSLKILSETVRKNLINSIPFIRCLPPFRTNPYIYEVFLPGKWFIVFVCKTSSILLGEEYITLANGHMEKVNAWLVMRSAFSVVIGPGFKQEAIEMAETLNVQLLDAGNFLRINSFLKSLKEPERESISDFFPFIFSHSSGLVNIENEIQFIKNKLEEK